MRLIRFPGESLESYCFRIYNVYGFHDLYLQHNYTMNGELAWSPKLRYDELMTRPGNQWVKGTYNAEKNRSYTRTEFIEAATHRSILDIEVMIDIDADHNHYLELNDIRQKAEFTAWSLRKKGKDISIYFTGSKSYHISYIEPRLRGLSPEARRKHKEKIVREYFGDMDLINPRKMISMEGAIHYRSGVRKEMVTL